MITMVGPGGPNGCSVFNCLERAVAQFHYVVTHPYQEPREVLYQFCEKHNEDGHRFQDKPWQFPNYSVKKEMSL